jgi:hypothetical protein
VEANEVRFYGVLQFRVVYIKWSSEFFLAQNEALSTRVKIRYWKPKLPCKAHLMAHEIPLRPVWPS